MERFLFTSIFLCLASFLIAQDEKKAALIQNEVYSELGGSAGSVALNYQCGINTFNEIRIFARIGAGVKVIQGENWY